MTAVLLAWVGALLVLAGATCCYVAAPNQQLTTRGAGRARAWSGVAALCAGLVLLLQWAGPATAVFIAFTLAMLVWSVVPLAAAWARRPRRDS